MKRKLKLHVYKDQTEQMINKIKELKEKRKKIKPVINILSPKYYYWYKYYKYTCCIHMVADNCSLLWFANFGHFLVRVNCSTDKSHHVKKCQFWPINSHSIT